MDVIGIDLGGSNIKAGRFTPKGTCWERIKLSTADPPDPCEVITQLVEIVRHLQAIAPERPIAGVGIGLPGPADATGRIALRAINMPGWIEVPLADELEARTGLPTAIANDANCAGIGEVWQGAGRGARCAVLLTLGTGVGGAVMVNGQLFAGHYGAAGELGLVTLRPDGPACNSGNSGSLEQYVSATAIRRRTSVSPRVWDQRARDGDPAAIALWEDVGRDLGIGLSTIIYVLTPDVAIIGGGVGNSADLFLPRAIAEVERRVMPTSRVGLRIVQAQLGNQAGCLGAAKLALDCLE